MQYSAILVTVATTLYIRVSELIHLIDGSLFSLTIVSLFPPPQPLVITFLLYFYEFDVFRLHI